jgi:hypothetical protein
MTVTLFFMTLLRGFHQSHPLVHASFAFHPPLSRLQLLLARRPSALSAGTKRRPCHGGKRTTSPPLRQSLPPTTAQNSPFATTPLNSSDDFRISRRSWFSLFRSHAEERTAAFEIDHYALPVLLVLLLVLRSPIITVTVTVTITVVTAGNDSEAEASEPRLARPVAGIDHSAAQHCARLLSGSPDL